MDFTEKYYKKSDGIRMLQQRSKEYRFDDVGKNRYGSKWKIFIFGQKLHTNNLFTIFSIKNTKYTEIIRIHVKNVILSGIGCSMTSCMEM